MQAAAERPVDKAVQAAPLAAGALPPLSLYVHFPWCVRKCPYCDFNSYSLQGELPAAPYLAALRADLAVEAAAVRGRTVQSVFFGGGTPSLFPPQALNALLEDIRRDLTVAIDAEITLEANPGTIERGGFADYRAAGITRVSLGAQSFADDQLRRLGRVHSAAETVAAVDELHAAGLTNFNLDLMCALPEQDIAAAVADIEAALALAPRHVSHYALTLEPGTVFAARPPPGLPSADLSADLQQACRERLLGAGLHRYEVSGYAQPGAECRHNLNYWRFGDYLGIGAGAHGKRTERIGSELLVWRAEKAREPRRYLAAVHGGAAGTRRRVPAQDLPFEYLMNALRLEEGFMEREFEARTGLGFAATAPALVRFQSLGLLERSGQNWRPSHRGFELLNEVLAALLPAA